MISNPPPGSSSLLFLFTVCVGLVGFLAGLDFVRLQMLRGAPWSGRQRWVGGGNKQQGGRAGGGGGGVYILTWSVTIPGPQSEWMTER